MTDVCRRQRPGPLLQSLNPDRPITRVVTLKSPRPPVRRRRRAPRILSKANILTLFTDFGLRAADPEGARGRGLREADADPGAGDPARPRPAGISAASPRPAPARRPPSRCRSCSAWPRSRAAPVRKGCRVLVLSPTRELASQIAESFRTYGRHLRLSTTVVFGGVPIGKQERALARRGHPRRDAGPAARPRRAPVAEPARRRDPRARRGRPDARPGLHPCAEADRRAAPEGAADPVLLGHDAERDRRRSPTPSCAIRPRWR